LPWPDIVSLSPIPSLRCSLQPGFDEQRKAIVV
jgi:hypothetical protein